MQFKIHPHNSVTLCKYNFHPNLFFFPSVASSNCYFEKHERRNCGGKLFFVFNVGKKRIGEVLRMAEFWDYTSRSDTGTGQIHIDSREIIAKYVIFNVP